ncbi:MAG: hypothetical protein ACOCP4_07275 [Candidatus Woesearchaeota archaeon]
MDSKLEILNDLDNDKITAAEAQSRLKALRELNQPKHEVQEEGPTIKRKARFIKIKIDSNDGDKVNVQVPLQFAKFILKGSSQFIKNTSLEAYDINPIEVLEMVESGIVGELVNIESAEGDKVKIYVE